MKRINFKAAKPNFQRCQQILEIFSKQKLNTPYQQIHKFVGRFDRSSIRSEAHFKPLQQMIQSLTPKIVNDRFITSTPLMMSNMACIYGNLNLYSSLWMDRSSQIMIGWITKGEQLGVELLYQTYRAYIELNQDRNLLLLHHLRTTIKDKIILELQKIIVSKNYQSQQFPKKFEIMHKYIRAILMDKQSPANLLNEIFQLFDKILEEMEILQPFKMQQKHPYFNCAISYEFCKVLKIQLPDGRYQSLLKNIYDRFITPSKLKLDWERKGESVFENRFQKCLYINGYEFQGNIKIGVSEYDVLVKGKNRKKFKPFQHIDLEQLKKGQFNKISSEQLQLYQKMTGLWYIGQKKRLKQDLIINLNGPFHYIVGDKSGIVRTGVIKETVLKHYGFSNFKQIDFRQWEAKTSNQRAITDFLETVIKF